MKRLEREKREGDWRLFNEIRCGHLATQTALTKERFRGEEEERLIRIIY